MLRSQGAPAAANSATTTAITIATDRPSLDQIGPKLAEPGQHNRTHQDMLLAIVTSRGPQNTLRVETYVTSWYKNNTIPKTNTIDKKVSYKTFKKQVPICCPYKTVWSWFEWSLILT